MINSVFHRHTPYLTGLAILLMIAVAIPVIAQEEKEQVVWGSSIEDAMKQSAETGKPVMMDFYTDW